MMELGFVDRLRLMIFPLLLGTAGREPIFAGYQRTSLELIDTRVLDSTLALLEYRPTYQRNVELGFQPVTGSRRPLNDRECV